MKHYFQATDWRDHLAWLACLGLPLFGWFVLQTQPAARLSTDSWASSIPIGLWTSHLLHFTFGHFLWDALMFTVFAALLWPEERWRLWLWIFAAAPILSITVFLVDPALVEYRGLSALDTMLFTRFCLGVGLTGKARDRLLFGWLPVFGLATKILFEFSTGNTLFVPHLGPDIVSLPIAHLAGACLGGIWTLSTLSYSAFFSAPHSIPGKPRHLERITPPTHPLVSKGMLPNLPQPALGLSPNLHPGKVSNNLRTPK